MSIPGEAYRAVAIAITYPLPSLILRMSSNSPHRLEVDNPNGKLAGESRATMWNYWVAIKVRKADTFPVASPRLSCLGNLIRIPGLQ